MAYEMDGLVREQRAPLAPQDDLIELFDRHDAAEQDVEEPVLEQQGELPEVAAPTVAHSLVAPAAIPLIYSVAMGVNGLTALVFGRLFDRYGVRVLSVGIAISLLALPFGFLGGFDGAVAAAACWATGLGAQDASLRGGIAQVVSMNKRGSAFGAFNGIYGVAWFAGSVVMGILYDHSITALVIFGVALQALAAIFFLGLHGRVRQAAAAR